MAPHTNPYFPQPMHHPLSLVYHQLASCPSLCGAVAPFWPAPGWCYPKRMRMLSSHKTPSSLLFPTLFPCRASFISGLRLAQARLCVDFCHSIFPSESDCASHQGSHACGAWSKAHPTALHLASLLLFPASRAGLHSAPTAPFSQPRNELSRVPPSPQYPHTHNLMLPFCAPKAFHASHAHKTHAKPCEQP